MVFNPWCLYVSFFLNVAVFLCSFALYVFLEVALTMQWPLYLLLVLCRKYHNPLFKAILNLLIGEPMFYWIAGFSWAEIAYK